MSQMSKYLFIMQTWLAPVEESHFCFDLPDTNNHGFSSVSYSLEGWAAGGQSQSDIEDAV